MPRKVSTVTFRTVKALWYGEIDDPGHWAARDIKRAAAVIEARKELKHSPINIKKSLEGFVRATRIFIARRLLALSASLALGGQDRSDQGR